MVKTNFQNKVLGAILVFISVSISLQTKAQTAGFSMPNTAYKGTAIQMINDNPTTFTSHQWDIDDNGSIDYKTTDATHTFTTVGIKCVRLSSQNSTKRDSVLKCINIVNIASIDDEMYWEKAFRVLPNPSKGEVNLSYSFNALETLDIKIYNSVGSLIYALVPIYGQTGAHTIDMTHDANGLYIVSVIVSGKRMTRSFNLCH